MKLSLRFSALGASLYLATFASLCVAVPASAQGFPNRPIHFIVPWNAGGSNDISARTLAELLAKEGVQVIVENVPGATGAIGLQRVASASADGYTIGMGTSSTLAAIAQDLTHLRNDQFAPIVRVTLDPLILLVSARSPYSSLQAFIANEKKNPGKVTIGTPGSNNLNHIFAVMAGRAAGVDIVNVPYTGGSKVLTDLAGQQIEAAVLKPSESKGQIDGGLVKPIGVFSNERLKSMPDVPTFKELGYDVFPYGPLVQMAYIVAPAKTPAPIRARLIEIFNKAIQSATFKASSDKGGSVVDDLTGAALGREIDNVQKSLDVVGKKVFVADKK